MTASEKTKIQRGIDHIHKHPNCRTDDLAAVMDCDSRNVAATLWPALQAGLVISCKVERPGQRAANEFRLSAASPDGKAPIWPAWKANHTHLAPKKPGPPALPGAAYKDTTRNVVHTPAGRGANNTGSRESGTSLAPKKPEVAAVAEPPKPDRKPAQARSDERPNRQVGATLVFGCSSDGTVTIASRSGREDGYMLTPDEADDLYAFLGDTKPIWGAA